MDDCLFCKIGEKKIPAKIVYEDADMFAFEDIHPQAPAHVLICPRKHLVSLTDATAEDTVAARQAAARRREIGQGAQAHRRLPHGIQ